MALKSTEDTHEVKTVWVELAAGVAVEDVDLGLVDEADDLEVAGGLHELHAGDGALGDEAGA